MYNPRVRGLGPETPREADTAAHTANHQQYNLHVNQMYYVNVVKCKMINKGPSLNTMM
jgi:hypothetical protein